MTTRRERVLLELEDHFTGPLAKATVATEAFDRSLSRLSGSQVDVGRSSRVASGGVDDVDRSARRADPTINQLTGRLRLFADLAAMLGPGLIPIAAVGVPALGGLASATAAAAIAGGSAIVAFQGVVDAVKAVDAYQLDPTVASLEKAQQAVHKLGPDAAMFAAEFQKMQPVFGDIRDAAAAGWFPGLTESLEDLERLAPDVMRIFEGVGRAGGDAVARGAEALAGPEWEEFRDFLATEAPSAITEMSKITGSLTHSAVEMWMAFDPGNDRFLSWAKNVTSELDQWASSAEGRRDIESFLDYVQETGPDVAEAFGSLVNMFTQITQAAAPLGGPVLDAVSAVANVVAAIADSDVGTPIFAGLAALSAYNRALTITGALQKTAFGQKHLPQGLGIGEMAKQARAGIPSMSEFGTVAYRLGQSTSYASKETLAARQSVRSFTSGLARAAAPVAGFGLLVSGAADNLGLTNTASLGLMGIMGGPFGAALGAGAGFVLDMKSASDKATDSIDQWNTSLRENAESIGGQRKVLADARVELDAFRADVESSNLGEQLKNWIDPDAYANAIEGLFGDSNVDEQEAALARMRREVELNETAVIKLGQAMGTDIRQSIFGGVIDEKAVALLERARPAMDALGYTIEDVYAAARLDNPEGIFEFLPDTGELGRINSEIAKQAAYMDSGAGRTKALSDAMAGLDDNLLSTADSAGVLEDKLNSLLGPNLGLSAATDAWTTALRHLDDDLAKHNKTLRGNTDAAIKNRAAIRDRVGAMTDVLTAEAAAGAGSAKLSRHLREQRGALIEAGVAAGISRKDMRAYLDTLGLTPKLVKTLIRADTGQANAAITETQRRLDTMRDAYVNIHVTTSGTGRGPQDPNELYTGGYTGDGGKYEPAGIVHRGEVVIPQERVKADWPMLKSRYGDLPGMADGGYAGGGRVGSGRAFPFDIGDSVSELRDALRELRNDVRKSGHVWTAQMERQAARMVKVNRAYEKQSEDLDNLRQSRRDYASTAGSSFTNDIFGNGVAGLGLQLQADSNDYEAMQKALKAAGKKGLDGGLFEALGASGDLNTAQQLATSSRAEIRRLEKLYEQRQRAGRDFGTYAADQVMGEDLRALERATRRQERVLTNLDHTLSELATRVEHGARRGVGDRDRDAFTRNRNGR